MLAKKCYLVGIFILFTVSLVISAPPPVNPATGEPLVIDCFRGTPTAIDGDLSDWNLEAMTPAVLNVVEQLFSGQESWTGPDDCSGEFYVMWDDVNIYIAAVVKDDTLSMNKTGGDIWNADCVEVFFATTNAVADHSEHYQYGFNADNQRWNWCNMDGAGSIEPDYLQIASAITADGYICEVSIPYGQMPSLDFSAGNTIGLHPVIDDTDSGDRELQMTWTGLEAHDQSLGYGHMILSADPVPAPEPVNPGTEGLVAYYPLDNDANDGSGNGLDGTLVGDPAFVEGQVGMALELDGDDYVDCGNPPELVITDAISIACWVNPAQLGGEQGFAGLDAGYSFKAHGEGVRFTTPGILDHSSANLILEAGVWQHVAVTFQPEQDEGLVFYLNGIETDRMTSSAINVGSGPFRIGNNQWDEFLTGLIDEVTIYNRILSEPEILYLAGYAVSIVVDDFESYTDVPGNMIWETWRDGFVNNTGASTGYVDPPHTEVQIVHGGNQAMPFFYDNDGTLLDGTEFEIKGTEFYAETQRTWDEPQDWTRRDVEILTLWFYGEPDNPGEPFYVGLEDSTGNRIDITHPDPMALTVNGWQQWRFTLADFTGVDLTAIKIMYIGVGDQTSNQPGGSGLVRIDDIELRRSVGQ
ncbi:MAG: sugar-binding protein [Sedimentisphaerales bacterium]